MRKRQRMSWPFGLVTLMVAALLVGCGATPPNAPAPSDGQAASGGGAQLLLTSGGETRFVSVAVDSDTTNVGYVIDLKDATRLLYAAQDIEGDRGGTIKCGRFVLTIPPKAFSGSAKITMTIPDSSVSLCDMEIEPATLNHFDVPVQLTLNLGGLEVNTELVSILWWDPAATRWVDMQSAKNLADLSVSAELSHFSRYAGGKAGW